MKREIENLSRTEWLFPTPNIPDLASCVLFQHNVEASIWQRHVENVRTPVFC